MRRHQHRGERSRQVDPTTIEDRIRSYFKAVKASGRWDPGTTNYMSHVWMACARKFERPIREIKAIVRDRPTGGYPADPTPVVAQDLVRDLPSGYALGPEGVVRCEIEWHALLAVEGVATVDGRYIKPGALEWPARASLQLRARTGGGNGHDGAQNVGSIMSITRRGPWILAEGNYWEMGITWLLHSVRRAALRGEPLGIGLDLDVLEAHTSLGDAGVGSLMVVERARVLGATIYADDGGGPAFPQCRIVPIDLEGVYADTPV